jgi:uncharacterized protein with FMN-binding domain
MRRIVVAVMSTLSGLVMLFSYHTSTNSGTTVASGGTSNANGSGGTSSSGTSSGSSGTSSGSTTSSSGSGSATSGTYTGDAADTRWGTVQVQITVQNGKVTNAQAIQYPNGNGRDQEINSYAIPQLNSEVVSKQSASIDSVSGATVTSGGYLQSLQSAFDKAHL